MSAISLLAQLINGLIIFSFTLTWYFHHFCNISFILLHSIVHLHLVSILWVFYICDQATILLSRVELDRTPIVIKHIS